jgi:hypothetical protein
MPLNVVSSTIWFTNNTTTTANWQWTTTPHWQWSTSPPAWVNVAATAAVTSGAAQRLAQAARDVTPAVQAALREQQERAAAAQAERQQRERAAEVRAEALLLELLDDEQQAQWRRQQTVDVRGCRSGKLYRLQRRRIGNVIERAGDRAVASYCIHHPASIPLEDQVAAQKLLLETNEDEFLRIANRTPIGA